MEILRKALLPAIAAAMLFSAVGCDEDTSKPSQECVAKCSADKKTAHDCDSNRNALDGKSCPKADCDLVKSESGEAVRAYCKSTGLTCKRNDDCKGFGAEVCENGKCKLNAEGDACTKDICTADGKIQKCGADKTLGKAESCGEKQTCKDGACVAEVKLPADVPTSCVKGTDPAVCSKEDGNAYFCGDDGYYLNDKGTCTGNNKCVVCPDGFGGCSDNAETFCKDHQGGSTEKCDKTKDNKCNADKLGGQYCTNNGIVKFTCTEADCHIDEADGKVKCTGQKTEGATEPKKGCGSDAEFVNYCSEDKNTGAYCNTKEDKVVNVTCATGYPCTDNNGFIACLSTTACTNEKAKCDTIGDKKYLISCDSTAKVLKAKHCPTKCEPNPKQDNQDWIDCL